MGLRLAQQKACLLRCGRGAAAAPAEPYPSSVSKGITCWTLLPSKTREGSHGMELRNMRLVWATTRRSTSMLKTCTRYVPLPCLLCPGFVHLYHAITVASCLPSSVWWSSCYWRRHSRSQSYHQPLESFGAARFRVLQCKNLALLFVDLHVEFPSLTLVWSFSFRFVCS